MAETTIRSLAILRSRSMDRSDAVDALPRGDWADQEKEWANRSWCRQCDALGNAIMAEAPTCVADVLSVLLVAQEKFEVAVIMDDDAHMGERTARACEQMRIVLANCSAALAAVVPDLTPLESQAVRCSRKLQEWWLPHQQVNTAPAVGADAA